MANTIAGEETVHKLASLLLIILGGCYMILFLSGKGGHSHSHNQPMEKMAVAGLVLVPALSPCATTLPVFLAVGNSSSMMVLAIIVLLFRYQCYVHSAFWVVILLLWSFILKYASAHLGRDKNMINEPVSAYLLVASFIYFLFLIGVSPFDAFWCNNHVQNY